MELIRPSAEYKDSYIIAMREFQNDLDFPARYRDVDADILAVRFDDFILEEIEKSDGKHLSIGFVPETIFWFVDKNEYIGRVAIRHTLTEHLRQTGGQIGYEVRPSKRRLGYGTQLLKLALIKAKEFGMDKVFLTCDVTNIASKNIIIHAGGKYEGEGPGERDDGPRKYRYWIST